MFVDWFVQEKCRAKETYHMVKQKLKDRKIDLNQNKESSILFVLAYSLDFLS